MLLIFRTVWSWLRLSGAIWALPAFLLWPGVQFLHATPSSRLLPHQAQAAAPFLLTSNTVVFSTIFTVSYNSNFKLRSHNLSKPFCLIYIFFRPFTMRLIFLVSTLLLVTTAISDTRVFIGELFEHNLGDNYTIATGKDSGPLPSWLMVRDQTLTGIPTENDVGRHTVMVSHRRKWYRNRIGVSIQKWENVGL